MGLSLLLPAALAALAALALPLAIHLARRTTLREVDFAALRWLRPASHPQRRLRFERWPLLLLRLALLALLALWLAQPVWRATRERPVVAVMPGVHAATIARLELPGNADLRWLADGFPALESPMPASPQPITSLLRQLDAELAPATALTVLATAAFDGADAQRPQLSREVDWRVMDDPPPAHSPPAAAAAPVLVLQAGTDPGASAVLRAVARAWRADADTPRFDASHPPDPADHLLAWLDPAAPPTVVLDWVRAGGVLLLDASVAKPAADAWRPAWSDAEGRSLLELAALGRGRMARFSRPLHAERMPELFEADFPRALLAALQPAAPAPTRAVASQYRPRQVATTHIPPGRELRPWLGLLIALLFALERLVAARGWQRSAA